MPQTNIYLDEEEDRIIIKFSKEYKLSKQETIKKIIRDMEND